jgi:uncharacterized cysteine cluster protein YcgN (CxxCxxCC family)
MDKFWIDKPLDQLSPEQWEALCDGCGRCCLQKIRHQTTGKVYYTSVSCHLLDLHTCRCKQYTTRQTVVPGCIELTPYNIIKLDWMPRTCAYRLLAQGKDLPDWHPLVSQDPNSVHTSGISIRNIAIVRGNPNIQVTSRHLENMIIHFNLLQYLSKDPG